ncbi:unnamed protein product [Lasius platythorax]|uniref:Uncharacterized protein n=1 Tax=Lasius platythorax TaxID=488582 RepID=A0AAV2MVN2_9HYME
MSISPIEQSDVQWCPARVSENKRKRVIKDRGKRGCVVSPGCLTADEEIEVSSENQDIRGQREGLTTTLLLVKVKATGDRCMAKPLVSSDW